MIDTFRLIVSLALIHSFAAALPVKREIITRMHTAPTHTNLDVYSTTTRIHIAPTVEYIVDGEVTYTTTLVPPNVDSNVQPSTSTIYGTTPSTAAAQPSFSQAATPSQSLAPASTSQAPPILSQSFAPASASQAPPSSSQSLAPASTSQATTSSQTPVPASSSQAPTSSTHEWTTSTWGSSSVLFSSYTPSSSAWTSSSSSASSSSLTPSSSTSSYPSSSSQPSTSSGNSGLIAMPIAVTYSPYNSDSSCKTSDEVKGDLQILQSKGITTIRVYGTECNSLDTVLPNASEMGIKVNQGLWISQDGVDSIDDAVNSLIQYGQQIGWGVFDFITIGNEAINSGFCSVSDLISKIQSVKSQLANAGYQGSVTTSEPPVSFENHPELCTQSGIDFVGINPHSYFDPDSTANLSGQFLQGQFELAQAACPNMDIFITETGYPHQGDENGQQIPSKDNQRAAINSILEVMGTHVTVLAYFDDLWKQPGPYGIEQYFGIEDLFA